MSPSFRRLWLGQSVSLLGSQVAQLALPLIAVERLHASVASLGLMALLRYLPFLLLSLPVGAWVDRWPRRPVLIATNLARAVLVGAVAVLAVTGLLRMLDLYVLSLASGVLSVVFVVAFRSAIPTLVGTDELVTAQSKLEGSETVARIAGPGIAGVLVTLLSAPLALVSDAASFVVAAASARSMTEDRAARPGHAGRSGRAERADEAHRAAAPRRLAGVCQGLRTIAGHPLLRALAAEGAIANLCSTMIDTLFVVFAVRVLALDATAIGVVLMAGGAGALMGTAAAAGLGERFGSGRACLLALGVADLCLLALPAAGGRGAPVVLMLAALFAVEGAATAVFEIHTAALTYQATPPDCHGRIQAGLRFTGSFGLVAGAAFAGGIGQLSGPRLALVTAAVIGACHWPIMLRSPLSPRRRSAPAASPI